MLKYVLIINLLIIVCQINLIAQNIYNGGNDDGHALSCFAQNDNPLLMIFNGGNNDGHALECFAQNDNPFLSIFNGGYDDGHALSCFAQNDNPFLMIFNGGNNDGHALECFAQNDNPLLSIFNGGNDDGHAISCFAQNDNPFLMIFNGGNDDGHAKASFIMTSSGNTLPIQLLDFDVVLIKNFVSISWQTLSEINNNYFTIEKTQNSKDWTIVNKVNGAGNSFTSIEYSDLDKNPFKGVSYYRLKQTDFDGQFTYSNIKPIFIAEKDKYNKNISVYPNPVEDFLNIDYSEDIIIEIKDVLGKQIVYTNSKKISLSHVAKGVYYLTIFDKSQTLIDKQKIIKK